MIRNTYRGKDKRMFRRDTYKRNGRVEIDREEGKEGCRSKEGSRRQKEDSRKKSGGPQGEEEEEKIIPGAAGGAELVYDHGRSDRARMQEPRENENICKGGRDPLA